MNDQLKTFLSGLLFCLVEFRKFGNDGGHRVSYSVGQITAAERLGVLTFDQADRFRDLLLNAGKHASNPFPCDENSGPCMPIGVWWDRHKAALEIKARLVKPQAQDSANDQHCAVSPAPATPQGLRLPELLCPQSAGQDIRVSPSPARRQLRLLCVPHQSKLGESPEIVSLGYLPIHTMHRVPPRAMVTGKWSQPRYAGLYLRETQAVAPSAEVLVRCERHRQANAFRATARTVRAGELSA